MESDVGYRYVVARVVVLQDAARVGIGRVDRRRNFGQLRIANVVVHEEAEDQAAVVSDVGFGREVEGIRRATYLGKNESEISRPGIAHLVTEGRGAAGVIAGDKVAAAV